MKDVDFDIAPLREALNEPITCVDLKFSEDYTMMGVGSGPQEH